MTGGKKLKDYPAVPATPPPPDKKDRSVVLLENELDQERLYLDGLYRENKEIESIVHNYEKELAFIKSNFPQNIIDDGKLHADNEKWFKYQAQVEANKKMEKERRHLEHEIKQIEEQGIINLDALSQSELILYVKQLERMKTDLTSTLRAAEWSLDKQAEEYHHLDDNKKSLEAEIRHYDEELAMFRHYKKTSCPSASIATSRTHLATGRKSKMEDLPEEIDGRLLRKRNSLGGKDDSDLADIMFSSLDESKLECLKTKGEPILGFSKRTVKGKIPDNQRVLDPRKGPIKKAAAVRTLPELKSKPEKSQKSKQVGTQNERVSSGKSKKIKTDTPRPISGNKSPTRAPKTEETDNVRNEAMIKIVVTDESDTVKTEKEFEVIEEVEEEIEETSLSVKEERRREQEKEETKTNYLTVPSLYDGKKTKKKSKAKHKREKSLTSQETARLEDRDQRILSEKKIVCVPKKSEQEERIQKRLEEEKRLQRKREQELVAQKKLEQEQRIHKKLDLEPRSQKKFEPEHRIQKKPEQEQRLQKISEHDHRIEIKDDKSADYEIVTSEVKNQTIEIIDLRKQQEQTTDGDPKQVTITIKISGVIRKEPDKAYSITTDL